MLLLPVMAVEFLAEVPIGSVEQTQCSGRE